MDQEGGEDDRMVWYDMDDRECMTWMTWKGFNDGSVIGATSEWEQEGELEVLSSE